MRLRMGPSILGPSDRRLPVLLPPVRAVLHHGLRLLPPNHHPGPLREPAAQPPRRRRALHARGKLRTRGRCGLGLVRGADHRAVPRAPACGRRRPEQARRTDGAALRARRLRCRLRRRPQQADVRPAQPAAAAPPAAAPAEPVARRAGPDPAAAVVPAVAGVRGVRGARAHRFGVR
jgi:hypothetical protein